MSQLKTLFVLAALLIVNSACSQIQDLGFFRSSKKAKIDVADFNNNNGSEGSTDVSQQAVGDQDLVVVSDEECLKRRSSSDATILTASATPMHTQQQRISLRARSLRVPASTTIAEIQSMAEEDECVDSVSAERSRKLTDLPNDSFLAEQKHLNALNFERGYTYFQDAQIAQDVVVAVIDDGIVLNHPDIRNQIWVNAGEVAGDGIDNDGNGYIDDVNGYDFADNDANISPMDPEDPHGTHVAGLIAAQTNNSIGVAGVYSKAKIMVLKVCHITEINGEDAIDCPDTAILNAIAYAANKGAKVANLSLGGPGANIAFKNAFIAGVAQGTTYFSSAGNGDEQTGEGFEITTNRFYVPAGYAPEVEGFISVAATDASNPDVLCGFSNFSSSFIEIAAPGCDTTRPGEGILSTWNLDSQGRAQYAYLAGTSMSSPIAAAFGAAIAGLTRHKGQNFSPSQLESYLKNNSRVVASLNSKIVGGRVTDMSSLISGFERDYPDQTPTPPESRIRVLASVSGPEVQTLNYNTDELRSEMVNVSNDVIACATTDATDPSHPSQNINACDNLPLTQWSDLRQNTEWQYQNNKWVFIGTPTSNGRVFRLNGHPYLVRGQVRFIAIDRGNNNRRIQFDFTIQ